MSSSPGEKSGSETEGSLSATKPKKPRQLSGDALAQSALNSKLEKSERLADISAVGAGGSSGDSGNASLGSHVGSSSSAAPPNPPPPSKRQPLSPPRAQSPTAALKAYEGTSPNTRQLIGRKRGRERRGALLPNTMTAKLVEQAAERHR